MFVVEKDFNEIAALPSFYPNAKIFLCRCHVLEALRHELKQLSHDSVVQDCLSDLCQRLVYAQTEETYDKMHTELQSNGLVTSVSYFSKNWHNKHEMLVDYHHKKYMNLQQTTTIIL